MTERQAATESCSECLEGTSNLWVIYSDFGNQFLPFGSPARKISTIRFKCTANSLRKTSEQCVSMWRMVNMRTSRWCLTSQRDESCFQNAFPPLFPKDESASGLFWTIVLQSSKLLPSSLLTDAKVAPPLPPIQSIHLSPTNRNWQRSVHTSQKSEATRVLPEISLLE